MGGGGTAARAEAEGGAEDGHPLRLVAVVAHLGEVRLHHPDVPVERAPQEPGDRGARGRPLGCAHGVSIAARR